MTEGTHEEELARTERDALAEADTCLPEQGATEEPVRAKPSDASDVIDAAEQAQAYDTLFRRAAEPRQLGRYVVLDVLGQGGMGVVLRAYDRELDRTVALKLLHREIDEQHTQRLWREAQAMAKLSHPNVVQVYEVGQVEGQTFVAMELVKGQTLHEWMRQRPRPSWKACVELLVQVGSGLAAAHERGLVHRDFKPGNAIVDDKGRPRVLDFGLARRDDEVDDEPRVVLEKARADSHAVVSLETSLTATGAVLGTPAYMPLEQMRGQEADARSDQFSFCVSLHEAVYGERPFDGSSMAALMISMREGAVRPAPKGSDVPVVLRRVLLRGLSMEPAQRWPSMEVLLEELRRLVAPRRRRWMVVGVSVGLVAIGGGLGATRTLEWWSRCTGARKQLEGVWDEARRQEVAAAILGTELSYAPGTWERVEPRLDAYAEAWAAEHTEACEATRTRDEQSEEEMSLRMGCLQGRSRHLRAMVDELSHADATVVEHAVQAVTSLPGLERCRDLPALRAEVPPPEDPAAAEQVAVLDERLVEALAKQDAGKYAEGLRLADDVVADATELGYEPLMARAWMRQGDLRDKAGDYEGSVTVLRKAYVAAMAWRMTAEAAAASALLVFILGDLARYDEARAWAEHVEPLSRAVGTDEARARYFRSLGSVAQAQGKHDEARGLHEQALVILEKALGPDHLDVGGVLGNLGHVAATRGKYEEARDLCERQLAIYEAALGLEHPIVAAALANLGVLAEKLGKYEEARDFQQRALAIDEKALGPDHPAVAVVLDNLGAVASLQREYEEARGFHERARVILEQTLGPNHPRVAQVLGSLGTVANAQGKHEQARDFFERALAISEKALGPDHADVAILLDNLGSTAGQQGKHEEARGFYEQALAIYEKALEPDHPYVAHALTGLGGALLALAKPADALTPLERALAVHATVEVDPVLLAETRFSLAHALWDAPAARGRDLGRARTLAAEARDGYAALGEAQKTKLAEVDAWLAEHPLP